MYRICGDSQVGKSHESKGTKCQDSHYSIEKDGIVFVAVADGLGSSKHSDIASNIASHNAVTYCSRNISRGMSDTQILTVIKSAFDTTNFAIKQKAGNKLDDYDTTLTLAVLIDGDVYYGHAGDSGIIALRKDGIFEEVTQAQLGSGHGKERPVHPLASENYWVFEKYNYQAKALFLMTDGMLNKAVPPLLEEQSYKMDHKYLYYLYDNLLKKAIPEEEPANPDSKKELKKKSPKASEMDALFSKADLEAMQKNREFNAMSPEEKIVELKRQLKEERTRAATAESELARLKELRHNDIYHRDGIIDNLRNRLIKAEARVDELEKLHTVEAG